MRKTKAKKGTPETVAADNQNAVVINTVANLGINRRVMAQRTGIDYQRMNRIFYGARTFTDEAVRISNFLGKSVMELFPQLFQTQSN